MSAKQKRGIISGEVRMKRAINMYRVRVEEGQEPRLRIWPGHDVFQNPPLKKE